MRLRTELKYLLTLQASIENELNANRFAYSARKTLSVTLNPVKFDPPRFDTSSHFIQLADNTPIGTHILAMKYFSSEVITSFAIQHKSNMQIESYFYLKHSSAFRTVYLVVKNSPIPIDKSETSFKVKLISSSSPDNYIELWPESFTSVQIEIVPSDIFSSNIEFVAPNEPNKILSLEEEKLSNGSVVYELNAINKKSPNSLVSYRILNDKSSPFFIQNNCVKIYFPIPLVYDISRRSFLVKITHFLIEYFTLELETFMLFFLQLFIEAFDSKWPSNGKTSTTIQFNLIKPKQLFAYFIRDEFASSLTLNVPDTLPTFTAFYDLTSLVSLPYNQSVVYFYVFNNAFPFDQSDTVYVDSFDMKLKLKQRLNVKFKSVYKFFILVSSTPLGQYESIRPSKSNKALLFIDLIVVGIETESPLLLDATMTMRK